MKKIVLGAFLVFGAFLLQATFFSQFNILGIVPNLLIILTSAIGFLEGRKAGMAVGFVSGLLLDTFFGTVYGVNAMFFTWIGFANGSFQKILYPKDIKTPLVLIAGSDLVYSIIFYFFHFFLIGDFKILYYTIHVIIPEVIYTTIIALLFYPFIHFCFTKLEEMEKKGE